MKSAITAAIFAVFLISGSAFAAEMVGRNPSAFQRSDMPQWPPTATEPRGSALPEWAVWPLLVPLHDTELNDTEKVLPAKVALQRHRGPVASARAAPNGPLRAGPTTRPAASHRIGAKRSRFLSMGTLY